MHGFMNVLFISLTSNWNEHSYTSDVGLRDDFKGFTEVKLHTMTLCGTTQCSPLDQH